MDELKKFENYLKINIKKAQQKIYDLNEIMYEISNKNQFYLSESDKDFIKTYSNKLKNCRITISINAEILYAIDKYKECVKNVNNN